MTRLIIREIKKDLETKTQKQLAKSLGYKSAATVCIWLKTKKMNKRIQRRLKEHYGI